MDLNPVPPPLLLRLAVPAVAAALFLGVSTVHGLAVAEFDSWHQSMSALALAPCGWIQALNFLLFGAAVLSAVPVWRHILAGGAGATWFPALNAMLGLSLVALAFVPQDPAPGYDPAALNLQRPTITGIAHLWAAAVMAGSSVGSMFVLARRFKTDPRWNGWAFYSRTMALLTVACVVVYAVWSVQPTGFAGTFERMAAMFPAVWLATLVHRLWRGAPIMSPVLDGLAA